MYLSSHWRMTESHAVPDHGTARFSLFFNKASQGTRTQFQEQGLRRQGLKELGGRLGPNVVRLALPLP